MRALPFDPTDLLCRVTTVFVLGLAGCSSSQTGPGHPQPHGTSPLDFGPCPAELPHAAMGECALVEVPLDWSDAERSKRIVLFLRRFRGAATTNGDQVWALDGGPGFAGDVFTDPVLRTVITDAHYDLYIPTHRGTVYGSGLQCAKEQAPSSSGGGGVTAAEFPGCIGALRSEWGDQLALFDSESAARDVDHLMARVRAEDAGRVVVYGGSYGSYWGQRLLQVAPDTIDGIWLDSIVDLDASFERADANSNDAGLRLLGACAEDADCSMHFANDASLEAIVARLAVTFASGEGCGQGTTPGSRAKALFHRLLSGPPWEQALVAPLLLRADRCNADDARAVANALQVLETPSPAQDRPPAYNALLNRHILLSELFAYDRSLSEVERDSRELLFSVEVDPIMAEFGRSYGPAYQKKLDNSAPASRAHLVLLQGGIDPLDRLEWISSTAERWSETRVSLVQLPFAGHSVVRYAVDEAGVRCSLEMLSGFLADPSAELDRACLERRLPFDIAGTAVKTQEAAERWFGAREVWGAEPPQ